MWAEEAERRDQAWDVAELTNARFDGHANERSIVPAAHEANGAEFRQLFGSASGAAYHPFARR